MEPDVLFSRLTSLTVRLLAAVALVLPCATVNAGGGENSVAFMSVERVDAGFRVVGLARRMADVAELLARLNLSAAKPAFLEASTSVSLCKARVFRFVIVMQAPPPTEEVHEPQQACAIVVDGLESR